MEAIDTQTVLTRWWGRSFAASGMTFLLRILLAVSLLGAGSSCSKTSRAATAEYPKVLQYAFIPSQEELQDNSVRIEHMRQHLERDLHLPIQMIPVSAYATTIEAMRAGKVDIATFGPFGYIIASSGAGAEAIIAYGDSKGELGSYNSVIVVPTDSPLRSIADLKARSREVVFEFADPASTSGNLMPRVYLQSIGIDPERDFKKTVYAGAQVATALTVAAHKVDAGAMSLTVLMRLSHLRKISENDLHVLWKSPPIPATPITVRRSLPADLKERIRQSLLSIPRTDAVLWEELKKYYMRPEMTFIAVNDSAYDSLRAFAGNVKGIELAEGR